MARPHDRRRPEHGTCGTALVTTRPAWNSLERRVLGRFVTFGLEVRLPERDFYAVMLGGCDAVCCHVRRGEGMLPVE